MTQWLDKQRRPVFRSSPDEADAPPRHAVSEYRDQTYRGRGIKLIINHEHVARVLRAKQEMAEWTPGQVTPARVEAKVVAMPKRRVG